MVAPITIGDRVVGPGWPCFIIAEAGVNHNGDADAALRMVDVAADAGAEAIKFQTFRADRLVTRSARKADYQQRTTDPAESQYEMLRRLELPERAYEAVLERCTARGVVFLSTAFDEESADFLEKLGMSVFKIPSGEIPNLPFLLRVAAKQKPMIVSTGMANLGEVYTAVQTIRAAGNQQILLLQCVSNYPATVESTNLRAMATMTAAFGVPVGYSDHTEGDAVALAAVALGACVIEKHFTVDRRLPGPDHTSSLEPHELAALVRNIRRVEAALGDGQKVPAPAEMATAAAARKSLVAACDIPPGTVLTEAMIVIKRPGIGLPPAMRPYVIGRTARTPIVEGTPLTLALLA